MTDAGKIENVCVSTRWPVAVSGRTVLLCSSRHQAVALAARLAAWSKAGRPERPASH